MTKIAEYLMKTGHKITISDTTWCVVTEEGSYAVVQKEKFEQKAKIAYETKEEDDFVNWLYKNAE